MIIRRMVDDPTAEGGRPPVITNKHLKGCDFLHTETYEGALKAARKSQRHGACGPGLRNHKCKCLIRIFIVITLIQNTLARWCRDTCGWSKYYCDLACSGNSQCLNHNAIYYGSCVRKCRGRYGKRCIDSCSRAWFRCSSGCGNNQCSCNCGVARDQCYQNCKVGRRLRLGGDPTDLNDMVEDDSRECLMVRQSGDENRWAITILDSAIDDVCACCNEAGIMPRLSLTSLPLPPQGYVELTKVETFRHREEGFHCIRDVSDTKTSDKLLVANITCVR